MHFAIQKDVLVKALREVTSAVATRVVQPILSNILVESPDETTIRFSATDLDLAIQSKCPAVVYAGGSITLPGKKLLEIVSKLPNELVTFQVNQDTFEAAVTCKRSKFTLTGLSAEDFPKIFDTKAAEGLLMPSDILRRAIMQTSFAAASYDTSNILGGVYLLLDNGAFESTATDGSRLAHRQETLRVAAPVAKREDADKEMDARAQSHRSRPRLRRAGEAPRLTRAGGCAHSPGRRADYLRDRDRLSQLAVDQRGVPALSRTLSYRVQVPGHLQPGGDRRCHRPRGGDVGRAHAPCEAAFRRGDHADKLQHPGCRQSSRGDLHALRRATA